MSPDPRREEPLARVIPRGATRCFCRSGAQRTEPTLNEVEGYGVLDESLFDSAFGTPDHDFFGSGSQSSIRFPSGSIIHPNFPYSNSSIFSSTQHTFLSHLLQHGAQLTHHILPHF